MLILSIASASIACLLVTSIACLLGTASIACLFQEQGVGNKQVDKASPECLRICLRIQATLSIATSLFIINTARQMTGIELKDYTVDSV